MIDNTITMEELEKELVSLYLQKKEIEQKIARLEKEKENRTDFVFSLENQITITIKNLSFELITKLKDLSVFENPQIAILQSLRKPIYNIPKKIYSFELHGDQLKLPRGLMRDVISLLGSYQIRYKIEDRRLIQQESFPRVRYVLKEEQQKGFEQMIKKDFSIFVAPPGFGKTLMGAKMIEHRGVNTLVVVNKNMLLDQWIDRFVSYFGIDPKEIGILGKGKNTLNNRLDIATMQSLKNTPSLIENYSFVIVDECHHIPALTFENIIKSFRGKYILGLSATPKRKDGMDPILFQQLGNISYEVKNKKTTKNILKIVSTDFVSEADNFGILLGEIIKDTQRNQLIVEEIKKYKERKILVLSDRIEHIEYLETILYEEGIKCVTIHGSMKKKAKEENLEQIESASLVLATTSYFGEGIDFAHLDTIILATPISFEGRLIQYLGRIGRGGDDCLAIDIYDDKNNFTRSSFRKRKSGYEQLHYSINSQL